MLLSVDSLLLSAAPTPFPGQQLSRHALRRLGPATVDCRLDELVWRLVSLRFLLPPLPWSFCLFAAAVSSAASRFSAPVPSPRLRMLLLPCVQTLVRHSDRVAAAVHVGLLPVSWTFPILLTDLSDVLPDLSLPPRTFLSLIGVLFGGSTAILGLFCAFPSRANLFHSCRRRLTGNSGCTFVVFLPFLSSLPTTFVADLFWLCKLRNFQSGDFPMSSLNLRVPA